MWNGIVMSNEEISEKYKKVWSKFENDRRDSIPRIELTNAIVEEFHIPTDVAEAYITISLTYYSPTWSTILDNVVRLMRSEMCHGVYEKLRACGEEPTVENAKKEIDRLKVHLAKRNEEGSN